MGKIARIINKYFHLNFKEKANIVCKSIVDDGLEDVLKILFSEKEKFMIQFHEESKTFHLYNDQISYIFKILKISFVYCL